MKNGAITALKGHYIQAFVCLLESMEDDWDSVYYEPSDEDSVVDICWRNNDEKRLVQVTHSSGVIDKHKFKDSIIRLSKLDAVSREFLIVGTSDVLPKSLEIWKQELKHTDSEILKKVKIRVLTQPDSGFEYLVWNSISKYCEKFPLAEDLTFRTLLDSFWRISEQLLREAVTKNSPLSKVDFEKSMTDIIKSESQDLPSYIKREKNEIEEFKSLFKFEPRRHIRRSIEALYAFDDEIDRRLITDCRNFFAKEKGGKLTLELKKGDKFERFGLFCGLGTFSVLTIISLVGLWYFLITRHETDFALFFLFSMSGALYFSWCLRPFFQFKRLKRKLNQS